MSGREFFVDRYRKMGWKRKNVQLKQAIRVNTINTGDTSGLAKRLISLGIRLEKIPFLENGYWILKSRFSVGATSEYLSGLYSIQEASAQIPVSLFAKLEGNTVLDACAAPGGKTVQLADLMHNSGAIMALDINRRRLIALSNHLERCRVKNTVAYCLDAREAKQLETSFDSILLDMPCSGNFATDNNWFKRRTIKDVQRNAAVQREILVETVKTLKPTGEMVYSTCSLEPEENELNIDWAIRSLNLQVQEINCHGQEALTNVFGKQLDRSIGNARRIWPGQTQGFFVCKLKRCEQS